jgi:uncharacterized protein (TIGR04255 family)
VARKRQLARPPIKEALIDIQLAQPMPQQFAEELSRITIPGYQKKLPVRFQQWNIEIAEVPQTSTTNELFGWRFESDDGSKILQYRRNGIGFSIVRGYTDWNEIKLLTQEFWTKFLKKVEQPVVNRLATRYINVIDVPLTGDLQFDNYLAAPPRLPENLPQQIRQFFVRLEVPFAPDLVAIITQTLDVPSPSHLPLILDIDVQMHKQMPGDSPDVWKALDTLREIKNDVFFSSVTEQALEPYE